MISKHASADPKIVSAITFFTAKQSFSQLATVVNTFSIFHNKL